MKNILIIIVSIFTLACFGNLNVQSEYSEQEEEFFVVDYDLQCIEPEPIIHDNKTDKIKICSERVLNAMRELLKTETSILLEQQVNKKQNQFSAEDIARAYCSIVDKRRDKLGKKDPNYVLASLVAIGMIESKFSPHANKNNKKKCAAGLQQVQDFSRWHQKPSRWALDYFGNEEDAIRPTKQQLINDLELNIDWSLHILRFSKFSFKNYNGHPENKLNYGKIVSRYVKLIMPILEGTL